MVASSERPLRMMVVHDKFKSGFFVAMVPAELSPEKVEAALQELGIDGDEVLELGGWRTSSQHVAVAHVPFPGKN
jgi:hypothetical protein